jgi:uncharacterized protein YutE (UPF0331/DUF86 family)
MSVNEEHVEAKIREINDAIQMLRGLTAKDSGKLTVYENLSMRYLMIQLVEAASSICIHILLDAFRESAEGLPECFMRLGRKGVIPEDLAEGFHLLLGSETCLCTGTGRSWTKSLWGREGRVR